MLPLILLVVPCQAAFDLQQVAIQIGKKNLAELAPVLVNLDPLDRLRLPCHLLGQALFGDITERLLLFRGINAGQSNLVLCDGVTIGHIDDFAQQCVGLRLQRKAQR